ncbi:hypothetical protein AKJ16_DCAP23735, partial [Drosera capensis]
MQLRRDSRDKVASLVFISCVVRWVQCQSWHVSMWYLGVLMTLPIQDGQVFLVDEAAPATETTVIRLGVKLGNHIRHSSKLQLPDIGRVEIFTPCFGNQKSMRPQAIFITSIN